MAGVLIVSTPGAQDALKSVFAAGAPALCCASAGEARRALLGGDYALLIVNAPLPDEFGRELAIQAVDKGLDAILLCAAPQAKKSPPGWKNTACCAACGRFRASRRRSRCGCCAPGGSACAVFWRKTNA